MDTDISKLLYSNNVKSVFSPFDFTLKFFVNSFKQNFNDGKEEAEAFTTELATIVMSPQHFKAFVDLLNKNLEHYEKEFGAITKIIVKKSDNEDAGS